jgi:polyisoprenyl-phosphate glycosyltransferase
MNPEFSLIIPFYNEETNVERVCEEIVGEFSARKLEYELIAVNNGSGDRTPQLLDKLSGQYPQIKVVTVDVNQGYGFGVRQGFGIASGNYIGYSVGDGQISAADVAEVFGIAREESLDFCQGKRIRKDTLLRRINTKVFNFTFHLFFPAGVYDVGSNPKIIKKSVLERISPVSDDWFIDGEIILRSYLLHGKMKEIPVTFLKREKGKSHINLFSVFEMLKNIIKWKIKTL